MNDRKIIAALVKFFPSSWRSEYGPELSSLLEQGSLTQAIIWNIFRSGISERLRRSRITTTGGALVLSRADREHRSCDANEGL